MEADGELLGSEDEGALACQGGADGAFGDVLRGEGEVGGVEEGFEAVVVVAGGLVKACVDASRADRGDSDTGARELDAEGFGESDNGVFGGAVDGHAGGSNKACDGGGKDHASAAGLDHFRDEVLGDAEGAHDIDVEDPAGVIEGHGVERSYGGHAGVEEEKLDGPEGVVGLGGSARNGVGIGGVCDEGQGVELACEGEEGLFIEVEEGEACAA